MIPELDSIAADILNKNRVELGRYKIKMDDPLLSTLQKEEFLTVNDVEHIQYLSNPNMKMNLLIRCLRQRVSRKVFLFFVECVGSIMKMPDLQRKLLNDMEKRCI